jgi:uncharacterized membrane protein
MAFCAKCGAAISEGSRVCPSCGAPAEEPASDSRATPSAPVSPLTTAVPMSSNVAAALAYLLGFITGIIFLVIEPYRRDSFVRFHAFQSIFLSAAILIVWIIWSAVFGALFFASFGVLWSLLALIWVLLKIGFFVLWLLMMYKAYSNERFMLPYIGPLAAKQSGA